MSLSEFFHIESSSNTNFKLWKKLTTSIGIKKNHQLLIYGEKIIKEVSQNNNINVLSVILSHNNKGDATELLNSFKNKKSVSTFLLSNELYKQLDIFNTQYPILVIKKPESRSIDTKELLNTKSPNLYLYLALSDPLNLGAVIRSATAFDAREIGRAHV